MHPITLWQVRDTNFLLLVQEIKAEMILKFQSQRNFGGSKKMVAGLAPCGKGLGRSWFVTTCFLGPWDVHLS